MIKYEYKIIDIDVRHGEIELNKLGHQGWEALGISGVSSSTIRIALKRMIASDAPFMAGV